MVAIRYNTNYFIIIPKMVGLMGYYGNHNTMIVGLFNVKENTKLYITNWLILHHFSFSLGGQCSIATSVGIKI
jgi:hypothetical protein